MLWGESTIDDDEINNSVFASVAVFAAPTMQCSVCTALWDVAYIFDAKKKIPKACSRWCLCGANSKKVGISWLFLNRDTGQMYSSNKSICTQLLPAAAYSLVIYVADSADVMWHVTLCCFCPHKGWSRIGYLQLHQDKTWLALTQIKKCGVARSSSYLCTSRRLRESRPVWRLGRDIVQKWPDLDTETCVISYGHNPEFLFHRRHNPLML